MCIRDSNVEIDDYLKRIKNKMVDKNDFGIFLTKAIGKIGDRHAYISKYKLPNNKCFPFAFAPYKNKVAVLKFDKASKEYSLFSSEYPFLKSIESNLITELISEILPEEILAPKDAYFTRAVRELREIEEIYGKLGKKLSNNIEIELTNDTHDLDTIVQVLLVNRNEKINKWDEQFYRKYFNLITEKEDYNLPHIYNQLFTFDDNIAYIHLPKMVDEDETPELYKALNVFMQKDEISKSEALIIDVRSNSGGGRGLIMELASYIVHPDSIHIVNVAQQRGSLPLSDDYKEDLNNRYLFSYDQIDEDEQAIVKQFNQSFKPMYELDSTKFSEFHYCILNGSKISKKEHYYSNPIYVLANERTFSAASVLVAIFKDLPNVKIAGVNTDGSSGNSERFELPISKLRGRMSTMVSFQKNGQILDGFGTEPDIRIERDLNQIFWKNDSQLKELKEIIEKTVPN